MRAVSTIISHFIVITSPPIGERIIVISVSVCVCVCLSAVISSELHIRVHVTYCHGSVLLWRRSDMLSTSGFVDDVIFAHKPRLLDVAAQLKCMHCTRSLGFGYKLCAVIPVAGQWTHGTTFWAPEVTSPVATPGRSLQSIIALLFRW